VHLHAHEVAAASESGFALVVGNEHSVAYIYQGEVAVWVLLFQSSDDEVEDEIDVEVEVEVEDEIEVECEDQKQVLPKIPAQSVDNSPKGSKAAPEASTSEADFARVNLASSVAESGGSDCREAEWDILS
jgi:hypothetical protein